MKRCESCQGTGQDFQEEPPCHRACPDCDGTGWDCSEVAEEVHALFFVALRGKEDRKYADRRRLSIARVIAHHVRGAEL